MEVDAELLSQLNCLLLGYLPFGLEIDLVPHQNTSCALVGVRIYALNPIANIVEAFPVGDVK